MTKVTLNLNDFKALASETRLDILRALDGKKLNLNDLSTATKLHKMTLHEHLGKLVEAGFVKKNEREGHNWVYYKLSWKGASLLHPENTRIVILFSATFFSLFFCMFSLITFVQTSSYMFAGGPGPIPNGVPPMLFAIVALLCLILIITFMLVSLWRYKKNKTPKL